jgi:heptosyltransferase I
MASTQEKTWPVEHYVELINSLEKRYPDKRVILTGGPGGQEVTFAATIQQQASTPCLNLVGKTTLPQLAAVLKRPKLIASPLSWVFSSARAVEMQSCA